MRLSLSKTSEIPLQQQLAEQIVFLITTGQLSSTQQLPSVRALARRLKIHHNTVSKAYQDLVRRGWLTRQPGSRLYIGQQGRSQAGARDATLDELINQCIERAREMGYSLQALRTKVLKRLFTQPPDHILVVEEEPGLCRLLQAEISSHIDRRVEMCSPEQLAKTPELAVGAQVAAPDYVVPLLKSLVPQHRPCISLTFCGADEHGAFIQGLAEPSTIGVASVSEALLKTARSLLALVVGERHTFREFLVSLQGRVNLRAMDVVFCDSLAMPVVRCGRKVHYRLIEPRCLEDLAATVALPRPTNRRRSRHNSLVQNADKRPALAAGDKKLPAPSQKTGRSGLYKTSSRQPRLRV